MVGDLCGLKALEEMGCDGVERRAFVGDAVQIAFTVPIAIKGGEAITGEHHTERLGGEDVVSATLDEACAVFERQVIKGAHLAFVEGVVADR